jgi:hypothetical protein
LHLILASAPTKEIAPLNKVVLGYGTESGVFFTSRSVTAAWASVLQKEVSSLLGMVYKLTHLATVYPNSSVI